MYLSHFQLQEKPFSLTPDTQFFMRQQSHSAALNTILAALKEGEGFIKVVGEVGTGKTLLCRMLLSCLEQTSFTTAYIPNPCLTPKELKLCVAHELGATFQAEMPSHTLTRAIFNRLLVLARRGKQVVLIVDETQSMPRETIESLRLLTNLETEKRKLLQVVILGQPELDALLNRKDLRQLKQRIMYSETLQPFDYHGVKSYINHRLAFSGCRTEALFSNSAIHLIAVASRGIPRLINILAHKSLICSFAKGATEVHAFHVAKAIADTPECSAWGKCLGGICRWQGAGSLPAATEMPR